MKNKPELKNKPKDKSSGQAGTDKSLIFSYLTLRQAIGFLGLGLPFVLYLGALIVFQTGMRGSISGYYYTGMRDVLVGALFAIGFFLFSYKGYERADDIAGNLGCLFAVGVALFPTSPDANASPAAQVIGYVHFGFATALFLTLIYFSLFLFTKTDPRKKPTRRKLQRNRVYRVCGYLMSACILLAAVYAILQHAGMSPLKAINPLFWLEAIAVVTFGVSWITKGEAILKDGP